jgi:2-phosphoglycolate phosphatase, prokaryotic
MEPTALVFDLDGTLVDSLPDLRAALNEMLREVGRRELSPSEVRSMIGDGTHALVPRALRATGEVIDRSLILENAHERFLNFYEAVPTKLSRLYPGVAKTLESLVESGTHLAVCTNKQQRATLAVLEGFGIAQYFEAIVGGDCVPFHKPDPRHLLAAIEQLHVDPNEAIMVGDNENDYAAARGAGSRVVLMRYGYLRVPAESLNPDAWLSDFSEIPNTLAKFAIHQQQH